MRVSSPAGVGHQMMRINSLAGLLSRMTNYLQRKSVGLSSDVCLVCADSGEVVTLEFRDGTARVANGRSSPEVVLSRRELTQLIFGAHPSATPPDCGEAQDILQHVFPYYFPIWELDHS